MTLDVDGFNGFEELKNSILIYEAAEKLFLKEVDFLCSENDLMMLSRNAYFKNNASYAAHHFCGNFYNYKAMFNVIEQYNFQGRILENAFGYLEKHYHKIVEDIS